MILKISAEKLQLKIRSPEYQFNFPPKLICLFLLSLPLSKRQLLQRYLKCIKEEHIRQIEISELKCLTSIDGSVNYFSNDIYQKIVN